MMVRRPVAANARGYLKHEENRNYSGQKRLQRFKGQEYSVALRETVDGLFH